MHRVIGKRVVDLDADAFVALRAGFDHLLLDIGTGDGKHVLHEARRRPDTLVVGLDAAVDAMRRPSARAAARPDRGGLPNALFLRAAAEHPPAGLHDVDELHVLMPWGSLLRGLVGSDPTEDGSEGPGVLAPLAATCRPGAAFLVALNLHAWRPPVPEVGTSPEPDPDTAPTALGPAYAAAGWRLATAEYLDDDAVAALATSWTKRLGSSRDRLDVLALRGTITP